MDTIEFDIPSVVTQLVQLKAGETYTRSIFVPAGRFNPMAIREGKAWLKHNVAPAVARAKLRDPDRSYSTHTIAGLTAQYDAIVAVVVRCEKEGEL